MFTPLVVMWRQNGHIDVAVARAPQPPFLIFSLIFDRVIRIDEMHRDSLGLIWVVEDGIQSSETLFMVRQKNQNRCHQTRFPGSKYTKNDYSAIPDSSAENDVELSKRITAAEYSLATCGINSCLIRRQQFKGWQISKKKYPRAISTYTVFVVQVDTSHSRFTVSKNKIHADCRNSRLLLGFAPAHVRAA